MFIEEAGELIHIYTGDGKGKTTAALGLAVRAACSGIRVFIGQFMKDGEVSESFLPRHFPDLIEMECFGRPGFIGAEGPSGEDLALAAAGLERLREVIRARRHGMVIADEACTAVKFCIIREDALFDLADLAGGAVELVMTGRGASERLIARADLATEMLSLKHYYDTGIEARRGIEY
ncbi:cob(I)yrinic acid a,c-diamide adenosyltransferase [Candidatus Fermentibacteria bacterium]|nr:cob(I)yrinic acid a,c-diamide adenosyltransferase [Candidatus Fermentibacteria bacterium]